MKIVVITESLVIVGGLERIIIDKFNYLASNMGYDITIISCAQSSKQNNAYELSPAVKQIKLNYPYYKQFHYRYPMRLWMKIKTEWELKRLLTKTIKQLSPDILVGILSFKADMICKISCPAKKIIECHEARYYSLADTERNRSFFSRLYMNLYKRNNYFRTIEKNADMVITLTNGDKELWKKAKRIEVIPNFSNIKITRLCNIQCKRVISVGRLSPEKGYDRLLNIWKIVSTNHPDWQLDIFGEGKSRNTIVDTITHEGIININLHQTTSLISKEYANSSICVMTSYYEGFGLTLLEALKHGIPCIAFDCPFGPASIIEDNKCGFLVEDGNIQEYAEKLSLLMSDIRKRESFSVSAIEQAKKFSFEIITQKWAKIYEEVALSTYN